MRIIEGSFLPIASVLQTEAYSATERSLRSYAINTPVLRVGSWVMPGAPLSWSEGGVYWQLLKLECWVRRTVTFLLQVWRERRLVLNPAKKTRTLDHRFPDKRPKPLSPPVIRPALLCSSEQV